MLLRGVTSVWAAAVAKAAPAAGALGTSSPAEYRGRIHDTTGPGEWVRARCAGSELARPEYGWDGRPLLTAARCCLRDGPSTSEVSPRWITPLAGGGAG